MLQNNLTKRLLVFCILIILFILFAVRAFLPLLGKMLTYEKLPEGPLAIGLVLSGGSGERIQKAAELYRDQQVPFLLMNGGGAYFDRYYADYMKEYAIRLGVPEKSLLLEKESLSTYENALFALPILKKHKFKTALLITSRFHTRRAYRIFKKVFAGSGIELYVYPVPDEIDYNHWWKDHEMAEKVLIEWAKTVLYWVKYS